VASTITAFIAMIAVGALKAVSEAAAQLEEHQATAAEVRFAAQMLQRDLENVYRDKQRENWEFVGLAEETSTGTDSYLLLYTVGRAKARPAEPEGDVYEVEYYIQRDEEQSLLMRRLWPNPDKESDPGGVAMVVAENIDVFEVRYFDGEEWSNEWPEDMEKLPELVEVTLVAGEGTKRLTAVESFIVNYARGTGNDLSGEQEGQEEEGQEGAEAITEPAEMGR